jgi:hypothetical protein
MVVPVAAGVDGLEPRGAGAEVEPCHELQLLELLQHAVDRRAPDLAPGLTQQVLDLQRRERALLS